MSRGGSRKTRTEPERRCIVTGDVGPRAGLIRFVAAPDGTVVADVLGKLPGRGAWVSAQRDILETAVRKGRLARATGATVPEGLVEEVERQLVRHLTGLIALARKSGEAVAGFEKVKAWLAEGRVKVLLQASDGSARGKGKLWTPEGARWFGCLTASELGLAFGRESVIHGALASGGLAPRVVEEAARLSGLRTNVGGAATGKEQTTT